MLLNLERFIFNILNSKNTKGDVQTFQCGYLQFNSLQNFENIVFWWQLRVIDIFEIHLRFYSN